MSVNEVDGDPEVLAHRAFRLLDFHFSEAHNLGTLDPFLTNELIDLFI